MERILLYLDDLDDVVFALLLAGAQRGRRLGRAFVNLFLFASIVAALSVIAWLPALSAGVLALISVGLLYRSVTRPVHVARR